MRAVDGLVLADVDVVGVFSELELVDIGDIGEVAVLARCHAARITEQLCLLESLLRPRAGNDVVGLAVQHQVHGDGRKLLGRAALQEEHLVVVGNAHQIAQVGFGLFDDALERS